MVSIEASVYPIAEGTVAFGYPVRFRVLDGKKSDVVRGLVLMNVNKRVCSEVADAEDP